MTAPRPQHQSDTASVMIGLAGALGVSYRGDEHHDREKSARAFVVETATLMAVYAMGAAILVLLAFWFAPKVGIDAHAVTLATRLGIAAVVMTVVAIRTWRGAYRQYVESLPGGSRAILVNRFADILQQMADHEFTKGKADE